MNELDNIIYKLLRDLNRQLPQPCLKTRECRMAGGCPVCFAEIVAQHREFEVRAFEEYRDREHDEIVFGTPRPKPD
jgi:hypothetical protein